VNAKGTRATGPRSGPGAVRPPENANDRDPRFAFSDGLAAPCRPASPAAGRALASAFSASSAVIR